MVRAWAQLEGSCLHPRTPLGHSGTFKAERISQHRHGRGSHRGRLTGPRTECSHAWTGLRAIRGSSQKSKREGKRGTRFAFLFCSKWIALADEVKASDDAAQIMAENDANGAQNANELNRILVRKKAGTPYAVYVPQGPRQDILCKAVTVRLASKNPS